MLIKMSYIQFTANIDRADVTRWMVPFAASEVIAIIGFGLEMGCGRPRSPALLAMRGGTARDNSAISLD
jgi:hypothetical protein